MTGRGALRARLTVRQDLRTRVLAPVLPVPSQHEDLSRFLYRYSQSGRQIRQKVGNSQETEGGEYRGKTNYLFEFLILFKLFV